MEPPRLDPVELLRQGVAEAQPASRGKLTIFFGAAPGVGKTYSMLEVARSELEREKRDVVIGIVESHGRYDTGALVLGLELLPRRKIAHRGVVAEEFDLDAALARRPTLILVDELAHTNAEGSRHPKRWQDVEELLAAGIDVFSTLNVQHVESLNDVVAKITGVSVRETVPDAVLERAYEIKLVDLPPDELLERLREGKVYVPTQARREIENFFRKGNLIALRELALRLTADRVDGQMLAYRRARGIEQTWPIADQILVAVSASPSSARLIRAACRIAATLHARWFAVYVEPQGPARVRPATQARLSRNLRLAEQLGGEVVTLSGQNTTDEILDFARSRNITKIILGKPTLYRLRDRFRPSLVDRIVKRSGDIDVLVTAGDREPLPPPVEKPERAPITVPSLVAAAVVCGLATSVGFLLFGRDQLPDVVMIYLLGIMLISSRYGFGASIFGALLCVAAFDFAFVPPYFTFAVGDLRHVVTFMVMFLVAVVISGLSQQVRNQGVAARIRERRTRVLYELTRELVGARGIEEMLAIAGPHFEQVFEAKVAVFAPDASGKLRCRYATAGLEDASARGASVSAWVWANQQEAGLGTSTLPSGTTLYVPLVASGGIVGVLGLTPEHADRFVGIEARRQVDTFAAQLALSMERANLAEQTERARLEAETEELRSSLLSSVSHDLRTPLAVITGAASTLVESGSAIDEVTRLDLMRTILDESERLNRLIRNLLDMTQLESHRVKVKKEWLPLEEVIGAALNRVESRLAGREVSVELAPELPLIPCDAVLIEQTLINLLENAAKYSTGPIEIRGSAGAGEVLVEIADHGPGIPPGQESRIFDKFERGAREGSAFGVGLGLAICRAIVAAHAGKIWVQNRPAGGAAFRFCLPLEGGAPDLVPEGPEPEPTELRVD
jgi:two-component system sensor histidine kinase KdpD